MAAMPEISTTESAAKAPASNPRKRLGYAVFVGARTLVVSFARTLYALWMEVTGLLFGIFTVMGVAALIKFYRANPQMPDRNKLWSGVVFTVICAWFTVVSFWKSRKLRKR
jgi:hypothetical protein